MVTAARRPLPLLLVAVLAGMVAAPAHAAFPGENGKILFQSGNDMRTMDPDGTNVQTVGPQGLEPVWSADGQRIAFCTTGRKLRVMDADGGNVSADLTSFCGQPAWSPDGTMIAYLALGGGLHVVNLAGGDRALTTPPGGSFDNEPAWSPGGSTIAFERDFSSPVANDDIYVVPAGGGTATPVNGAASADLERGATWSPDGASIAFVRDNNDGNC